jgi:peptidoglycan/LPS O-acetylase OafA/YrhL
MKVINWAIGPGDPSGGVPQLTGDVISEPEATSGSSRRLALAEAFSPRHNSLNFIRLAFCLTVIFSHAITLGGFGSEWILGNRTTIAVPTLYGFFCLSGFLIAGSATKNSVGRYLWQRFLRIMPGYWVCIVVTAFIIGALAWIHEPHPASCSIISCYYTAPGDGPYYYLYHNWLLAWNQFNVSTTPAGGPVQFFWNNSVWTLLPEVCCYLVLAILASLKLLRHRGVVLGLACGVWLLEVVIAVLGPVNGGVHSFGPFAFTPGLLFGLITLGPAFLAGAVLYLYRDKVPDSGWLALGFVVVFVVGSSLPFFGQGMTRFLHFLPGPTSVMAPVLAYPLVWLGIHLPPVFQRVGARNDYSYGVYIYGWPVMQLLGIYGVQHGGYVVYTAAALAGSVTLAVLSWHLVEKRALSLKKLDPRAVLMFRTRKLKASSGATMPSED